MLPCAPQPASSDAGLRICSLLLSATGIDRCLGLAPLLVCFPHECDTAPNAATLDAPLDADSVTHVPGSAIDPHRAQPGGAWRARQGELDDCRRQRVPVASRGRQAGRAVASGL